MNQSSLPLLTVVVMTRDSLGTLKEALASIAAEIKNVEPGQVEILVSDNSTSMETNEYFSGSSRGCKYVFHSGALTYDQHLKAVFQFATGDYVKILADDDLLLPGFVKRLFFVLQSIPLVDVVVSNFLTDSHYEKDQVLRLKELENIEGLSFGRAHKISRWRFGQVSSLTFRRNSWLQSFKDSYLGTNYLHQTMYFACSFKGLTWVDSESLILCRLGSPNFTKSPHQMLQTRFGGLRSIALLRGLLWKRMEFYQSIGFQIFEVVKIILWSKMNTNLKFAEVSEIAASNAQTSLRFLVFMVHKLSPIWLLKYLKRMGFR